MPKYKIGETLWYGHCVYTQIEKTCPVCFGKRQVTLTLGNNDQVTLECSMCDKGYEAPRGFISIYEYSANPKLVTIDRISTEQSVDGEKSTYYSGNWVYHENQLFANKEEAEAFGLKEKDELEKQQFERIELLKKTESKSFSWNAGYHMQKAQEHRKDAEIHEKKAVICKARSK